MPGKYFKIVVPREYRSISHAVKSYPQAEREILIDEFATHMPGMYFRGANSDCQYSRHCPGIIDLNKVMEAGSPVSNNEVSEETIRKYRADAHDSKLISLTIAPSVATFFASSNKFPRSGYVYFIQFEENAPNFYRFDAKADSQLAGEMEVFGVNGIAQSQIKAYCTYQVQAGIQEIYLADDLSQDAQEKIICSMLTGRPTSSDPAINQKIQTLMDSRQPGHDFYTPSQKPTGSNSASVKKTSSAVSLKQKPEKLATKKEKSFGLGLAALITYGIVATIGTGLVLTGVGSVLGVPLLTAAGIGFAAAIGGAILGTGSAIALANKKQKPLTQAEIDEQAQLLAEEGRATEAQLYKPDLTGKTLDNASIPAFGEGRRSPACDDSIGRKSGAFDNESIKDNPSITPSPSPSP